MPVVIADATADVEALGLALGRELAPVGSATTPTGSLVRYHDVSASREALATPGPRRDRALAVVDALLARHAGQRIGAVTTLALERELAPRVARVSHYGAARGSNTMRDGSIDVGIVLGVPRVPPHALRAWAIFVGGASLTDLEEQPSSRPLRDGSASVRVWSYREGSALARADHALTSAALRQAVGRFAGVQTVYVIADYPLGLGEELRAACHDLRVPLLPRPSRGGRPALDLAPLVEAARAHVAAGGDLLAHGATAACVRAAQPLGWRGTDRAARLRWDDVIAAVVEETCR